MLHKPASDRVRDCPCWQVIGSEVAINVNEGVFGETFQFLVVNE
jgi:hypothetical protein